MARLSTVNTKAQIKKALRLKNLSIVNMLYGKGTTKVNKGLKLSIVEKLYGK